VFWVDAADIEQIEAVSDGGGGLVDLGLYARIHL